MIQGRTGFKLDIKKQNPAVFCGEHGFNLEKLSKVMSRDTFNSFESTVDENKRLRAMVNGDQIRNVSI